MSHEVTSMTSRKIFNTKQQDVTNDLVYEGQSQCDGNRRSAIPYLVGIQYPHHFRGLTFTATRD